MTLSKRLSTLLVAGSLFSSLYAERPVSGMDRGLPKGKAPVEADNDDPTLRRAAMREWWGEYTPEYRQFLMGAAQKERERWGNLIPGNGRFMPAKAAGNHWTNLGPTDASYEWNGSTYPGKDSGRPVTIVVDPTDANIIYNATAGGGVWKTTDGGTTWSPITESLGSLSMGYLAMDPNNHNTLYLGLGDAFDGTGIGMVKSTDGGATWSSVVFLGGTSIINHIAVSPTNSQIVLAATDGGLYRSTDGGATFSLVTITTGWGGVPYCWAIAYGGGTNWAMTLEGSQFTSTTTGSGQIWYSSDDGATWTQATGFSKSTGVARASIASAPSSRTTMYAMAAVYNSGISAGANDLADFFYSTDAGHTWTALNVKSTTKFSGSATAVNTILNGQGWYNHALIVDPTTSTTFYAGGALMLASVTGATSAPTYTIKTDWLAQNSLPYVHADFHTATFDQNGVLYAGTDGGIFKRTAAGSPDTWSTSLNKGITSHLCYSVGSSLNNKNAVITGLQDNGTRVRSGSTSTFDQPLGGDGFGSHIHATDATKMLATLYYSRVYKSTTSGSTGGSFSLSSTGIAEANNSSTGVFTTRITPGLADATGNTVYTYSTFKVYKTTNYAGSWAQAGTSPISSGTIRNVGAAKSDGNVIGVVCSGGRYFLSANGGTTWSAPTALSNNGSSLSYISFSPANASVVYIASVAPSSSVTHLWKSTNSGSTWTALDTGTGFPTGVPVNCILEDFNDSQTLYAGTHEGLYRSTDGGTTWSRFGAGLPLVSVTDLYLAPDSSLLRVSTYGRGIWEFDTKTTTVSASITTPASNQTIASGTLVNFTGTASDADPASTLSYGWDFGDGATATGTSPSHTFTNATSGDVIYTVTFTATGSTGGSASATRSITVHSGDVTAPVPGTPSASAERGTVTLSATATDNVGVSQVEFYLNAALVGSTVTGSPYSVSFDTTSVPDGSYTLTAKAYDAANNSATASTTITIDNTKPTVSVTESGTTGIITFNATATDNLSGIAKVSWFVDGAYAGSSTSFPYSMTFDSTWLKNGSHTLTAVTLDNAGNLSSQSSGFSFSTSNATTDTIAPTNVVASVVGTSGTIELHCTATDNNAVAKVSYYVDGIWISTSSKAPFTIYLNSTWIKNGSHTLTAFAIDYAGNTTQSAPVTFSTTNGTYDTTAPTNISATVTGTSGTITFNVTATDDSGVSRVSFYVDNNFVITDLSKPFAAPFNSTWLKNGSHTLVAYVLDYAGNVANSGPVSFSTSNGTTDTTPPSNVTAVVTGSTGTITFSTGATDNAAVARVTYYVDGVSVGTAPQKPFSMNYNSTLLTNGSHSLVTRAVDFANNFTDSAPTTFNVAN